MNLAGDLEQNRITRTCGGDPKSSINLKLFKKVLPAHAGVILSSGLGTAVKVGITRTCGGDP